MNNIANDNTSISAYRVFETLKFLLKEPASVNDIIKHLASLEAEEKTFSKAVIYKYIATLKFFGIDIAKNKCKFYVKNLPFKIKISNENLEAIYLLDYLLSVTPESKLTQNLSEFIYQIELRQPLNENSSKIKDEIKNKIKMQLPTKTLLEEFKKYEKLCEDKLKINLTYFNARKEVQNTICEPIECNLDKQNIYLLLYSEHPNEYLEINTKQILKLEQLPSKCSLGKHLSSTTVFKIKHKLNKRYTLRENEMELNSVSTNERIISNKIEPKEKLLFRIMRYAEQCEILTPKTDRQKMKQLINETLSNYNIN